MRHPPPRLFRLILLLASVMLTGCDNINFEQYRVAGITPDSDQSRRLRASLQTVAQQVGLEDLTAMSYMPGTLAYFKGPDVEYAATELGAVFYRGDALVMLQARFGPRPKRFERASQVLRAMLNSEYPERVSVPSPLIKAQEVVAATQPAAR